jgi:nucleoside-diphosphate-sugar epimerase
LRILVTGAAGFIGRHLVPALLGQGDHVTLLLRETAEGMRPLPEPLERIRPSFDVVYADLRNYSLTVRALEAARPELVFHLAAAGVADPFLPPDSAVRNNVTGTLNLLRACFQNRETADQPRQVLVARTPGELKATTVYAASKAASWQFCSLYAETAHWPISGAMIFQAYGLGQPGHTVVAAAIQAALAGDDLPLTSGSQQRDWIHVDDVVAGLMAGAGAGLPPGTTFEVGTGRATPLAEVIELVYQFAGRPGRPRFGTLPDRPGEPAVQIADAARTAELTGWRAQIVLPDGLATLVEAYRRSEISPI